MSAKQEYLALRKYLSSISPGEIQDIDELENLLEGCWNQFDGADTHGMKVNKLGRMESVSWDPPVLHFNVERHGGTVLGSVYGEVQSWTVNLEKRTAVCGGGGRRLLRQRQKPLNIDPLVIRVVNSIKEHKDDECLKWLSESRVKVLAGKILPAGSAAKETLASRRKRLGQKIEQEMSLLGWIKVVGTSPHTYERADAAKAYKR